MARCVTDGAVLNKLADLMERDVEKIAALERYVPPWCDLVLSTVGLT